jgi:hypothetical protein
MNEPDPPADRTADKVKAGKNYGGDGVFRLSVDEFRRSFPSITISEL